MDEIKTNDGERVFTDAESAAWLRYFLALPPIAAEKPAEI